MARTTGPLLSLGGSGAIAKTQVYSTWRGLPYARQYVVPANPRTSGQTLTRNVFSFMNAVWKLAPASMQAVWTANAKGRPYTDRNKFIGDNVKLLREETDLSLMVFSPGANGGSAAAALGLAPAAGAIAATLTAPDLPAGWTITMAIFALIADQDPQTGTQPKVTVMTDAMTPFAANFTGLAAGDYVVAGWFQFLKPNGQVAYGASLSDVATAT